MRRVVAKAEDAIQRDVLLGAFGGGLVGTGQLQPLETVARDEVDDSRHGVRSVDGRAARLHDFHPLDQHERDGVDVHECGAVIGKGGIGRQAAAVEQGQRRTEPEAAQVHLRRARRVVLAEPECVELRARIDGQPREQVRRGDDARRLDISGVQHFGGHGCRVAGTAYVGAGDDDLVLDGRVLRECRQSRRAEHRSEQQGAAAGITVLMFHMSLPSAFCGASAHHCEHLIITEYMFSLCFSCQ